MHEALKEKQTQSIKGLETAFHQFIQQIALPKSRLLDAMQYALFNGGKRMRPLLVRLVADLYGANESDIQCASLAVECMHSYSLVHDDLPAMDDDNLRRGKPTCHIQFDEASAILAGDALQTLAFEVLCEFKMSAFASSKRLYLIKILARASGIRGMCAGQSLDLLATNKEIELEALSHLHSLKTGALLEASVLFGANICKQVTSGDKENLRAFAHHIGMAFQIQDDILDVVSDTETLGKPQGSDQANNKNTFVSKLSLEGAKQELNNHHQEALHALDRLPYNTRNLVLFTDYMMTRTF